MTSFSAQSLVYTIFPTLCAVFCILDAIEFDTRQNIYDVAWWISIVYFVCDITVEIFKRDCLTLLALKLFWSDMELYADFMHLGLTMELSNIFFNSRPLFERGTTNSLINDVFFMLSWFGSRVFYSLPRVFWLVVVEKKDGGSPLLLGGAVYLLGALHLYWGVLIIKKVAREFNGLIRSGKGKEGGKGGDKEHDVAKKFK